MILTCLLCAFFWVLVGALIGWWRHDGFHIVTVFCFLFACTYPLKLIATQYNYAVMNPMQLGEYWQYLALGVSNCAAIAFVVPLLLWARRPRSMVPTIGDPPRSGVLWLIVFLALTLASYGTGSLFLLRGDQGLWRQTEGLSRPGSAVGAILRDCAVAALMLYSQSLAYRWTRVRWRGRLALLVAAAALSYGLLALSYSKYVAALPIAIFLLSLNVERLRQSGRGMRLKAVLLMGPIALVAVGWLGYLRGFGVFSTEPQTSAMQQTLIQLLHTFDAIDNLAFILFRVHDFWGGDLFFAPTMQYIFIGLIPRFFWPSKPLIFGNQYIMERYLPERFYGFGGEVISPSMAGEMILSGGFFFMLIWSFLLGCLFAIVYRWAHQPNAPRLVTMIYVWLVLNTFNLLRSGTGLIGALITFIFAASIVLFGAKTAALILGIRARRKPALAVAH